MLMTNFPFTISLSSRLIKMDDLKMRSSMDLGTVIDLKSRIGSLGTLVAVVLKGATILKMARFLS